MRTFSSANAKNHFGELVDAARIAPVAITKYDKPFVVVLAVEQYERLKSVEEGRHTRVSAHHKGTKAGRDGQ